jgi:hypothetical protein
MNVILSHDIETSPFLSQLLAGVNNMAYSSDMPTSHETKDKKQSHETLESRRETRKMKERQAYTLMKSLPLISQSVVRP